MKKPDVALTPGFAGEPTMDRMSQTERIRTQRIRLVGGDFAATEPISLRIVLSGLHVLLSVKTQMFLSSGVRHRLADSELDARRRERFASLWNRCAETRNYSVGLSKKNALSAAWSLGGVVYQPRDQQPRQRAANAQKNDSGAVLRQYNHRGLG